MANGGPQLGGLGGVQPLAKILFDGTPENGQSKLKVKISVKRKKAGKIKAAKESRNA